MTNDEKIILRFKLFQGILGISKFDFASKLEIPFQNFNRLMNGYKSIITKSDLIIEIGCSVDWLITGNGKVTVDTPNGHILNHQSNVLNQNGYLECYFIKKRIIKWIETSYLSIDNFRSEFLNEEFNEFLNEEFDIINNFTIPNIIFITLDEAGCNLKWLLNDSNNQLPFNINEKGKELKNKFIKNKSLRLQFNLLKTSKINNDQNN